MIEHFLKMHKITTISCTSGAQALTVFQQDQTINAVITDLNLPEMSGNQTIMEIRKIEKQHGRINVPIIVLSAETDPNERSLCLNKYGATDYLLKPIKLQDIILSLFNSMVNFSKPEKYILIIDNENLNTCYLSTMLQRKGHKVVACNSIKQVS